MNIDRRANVVGHPRDVLRDELARRYGLSVTQRRRLTVTFMAQLQRCLSEEARKLLLGVR